MLVWLQLCSCINFINGIVDKLQQSDAARVPPPHTTALDQLHP